MKKIKILKEYFGVRAAAMRAATAERRRLKAEGMPGGYRVVVANAFEYRCETMAAEIGAPRATDFLVVVLFGDNSIVVKMDVSEAVVKTNVVIDMNKAARVKNGNIYINETRPAIMNKNTGANVIPVEKLLNKNKYLKGINYVMFSSKAVVVFHLGQSLFAAA